MIYQIPCNNCEKVYIGETARQFHFRLQEHRKEVDDITNKGTRTRSTRKESSSTLHKSAITDHAAQENHLINWEESKIVGREADWKTRIIKEAISIRKQPGVMNRDEGAYKLSHGYDSLLRPPSQSSLS